MGLMRIPAALAAALLLGSCAGSSGGDRLTLNARTRDAKSGAVSVRPLTWDPSRTAAVVIDMWDDHWCKGAAKRVTEMAGPLNEVVRGLRSRGVFILHAPSSTVSFYKDSPARKRAQEAPFSKTPAPLSTEERWGTKWCYPDPREWEMPIDDSDMGCDCAVKCTIREAWTRQIATVEIDPARDAVTDDGQETWNLLAQRGIDNVLIMGVHLNMCVLGRPTAIRQLVRLGRNVVLVRDLTDTMYNSKMKPFVDHHSGTDLVVAHVEKAWCPTITSQDLGAAHPFRFADDPKKDRAR